MALEARLGLDQNPSTTYWSYMQSKIPADRSLLPPYRVLDLTNSFGTFCTKLLGDYGADVVKVEPPSGDPGRSKGPFLDDEPHPERSMYFLFYNTINAPSLSTWKVSRAGRFLSSWSPKPMRWSSVFQWATSKTWDWTTIHSKN